MDTAPDLFCDGISPATVLAVLRERIGQAHGLTARDLVLQLTGRVSAADERHLRDVIVALRCAGHPVCGHPSTGYHLAGSAAELDRTCEFLYGRSMTSLRQISAMKRVSLPDLRGQLNLPANDGDTQHESA